MLARGPNFAPKETLPDKLLAHIASLGWEHIGFSSGYVWPSEPLKQNGSGPVKAAMRVPRCRLPYDLEQILR